VERSLPPLKKEGGSLPLTIEIEDKGEG